MAEEDIKATDETMPAATEARDDDGADSQYVDLPDASSLTEASAGELVRRSGSNVIVFAGLQGSGKTTLVASAYQRFLDGAFAGCSFQSSQSLRAFEDRCHLTRVASRRTAPTTARTEQSEGLQFLHLGVRVDHRQSETVNLLFADMAGEFFRRARDNADECQKLPILRRADHLVLLVDGRHLANPERRHACLRDARLLLRRFVECEMIRSGTSVQIVATKWDLVVDADDLEHIRDGLRRLMQDLNDRFSLALRSLSLSEIAASPAKKPALGVGYGVDQLFKLWTARPTWMRTPKTAESRFDEDLQRQADMFRPRSLPGKQP